MEALASGQRQQRTASRHAVVNFDPFNLLTIHPFREGAPPHSFQRRHQHLRLGSTIRVCEGHLHTDLPLCFSACRDTIYFEVCPMAASVFSPNVRTCEVLRTRTGNNSTITSRQASVTATQSEPCYAHITPRTDTSEEQAALLSRRGERSSRSDQVDLGSNALLKGGNGLQTVQPNSPSLIEACVEKPAAAPLRCKTHDLQAKVPKPRMYVTSPARRETLRPY